ncbi:MAG: hypothetical protein NZM33_09755 [Bryobacteraceae bacterium]|nr:hypothetical protein [Bryobacteraceae bacterium]
MWLALALLLSPLPAELSRDRFLRLACGPFEVVTNAGEREGRRWIQHLEQMRAALARLIGKDELRPVWPIRVVLLESPRQLASLGPLSGLTLVRDAYTAAAARGPMAPTFLEACARVLLEDGTRRLPRELDEGLAALFSTAELQGASQVSIGRPPPERSRSWAKAHWLSVPAENYGKLRTLIRNLEQGVAEDAAYRNSFGMNPAEVDRAVGAYLAAGQFGTADLSGRPLHPEKEIAVGAAEPAWTMAVLADLVAANDARRGEARQLYESLGPAAPNATEPEEGLGLLALRAGNQIEAQRRLSAAVAKGSLNARAHYELARLEPDPARARAALEAAAKLNPRWALPHWELARHETDPQRRLERLKTAVSLAPRSPDYWIALAELQHERKEFKESARAWAAAEQAAPDEETRNRIRARREQAELRRKQEEEAERLRAAEEKRQELERLKQQAIASIQAALEKANQAAPPTSGNVEPWWDDPRPRHKAEGLLQRVDCLGKQARLVIATAPGKLLRLLVRDPAQVVFLGGGETTLGCGPQRAARKIRAEYLPQNDAKLGTAGEVLVIEFPE